MGWGDNFYGQAGLTSLVNTASTPTRMPVALPPCKAVARGAEHTLVVTTDGRVWSAGLNAYGQLGDGTTIDHMDFRQVAGITTAVAVAAGDYHSLALLADGSIRAWGHNANGQVGDGSTAARRTPVTPLGLTSGVTQVAAGGYHSVALTADGQVRCWGDGSYGQIGNGAWDARITPGLVSGLPAVAAIGAGGYHTLVVLTDGSVRAWGWNSYGQLGDGTTTTACEPVATSGITDALAVVGAYGHSLVVLGNGQVRAWGWNGYGQLGDGTLEDRTTPVIVVGVTTAVGVAAGAYHSAARLADGAAAMWGHDGWGQLGTGSAGATSVATVVGGLTGVVVLVAGGSSSYAVVGDGALMGWGYQPGDGAVLRHAPSLIGAVDCATQVAVGGWHTLICREDGALFACGHNGSGQLGKGMPEDCGVPVRVQGIPRIRAVAAGTHHSLALTEDGRVLAWGYNAYGQLGTGNTSDSAMPLVVAGLSGVKALAAGAGTSAALLADGTVWVWGDGSYGQLGCGSYAGSTVPVQVLGLADVKAIAVGGWHMLALMADGTVRAWGYSYYGQLGDGTTNGSPSPIPVPGLANVTAIAAGAYHSLAVLADGTVRAWGFNSNGQIGDASLIDRYSPVAVSGLSGVRSVAASEVNSYALMMDGTVRGWGGNGSGQVGSGSTTTDRLVPAVVAGLQLVRSLAAGGHTAVAVSPWRATTLGVPGKAGERGQALTLGAVLLADTEPVIGRTVAFKVDGSAVGTAVSDATGIAGLAYTVPNSLALGSHAVDAAFAPDEYYQGSSGGGTLTVGKGTTSLYTVNRTGLVTTSVALKAYLKRTSDNAWLGGRSVEFSVAGTGVGSGATSAAGEAVLTYAIAVPAGTHTIGAAYAGEADYKPSSGSGTLTATTTNTKVYVVDRTAKVKSYVVLKSYLYTPTNVIIPGKPMVIKLDGTTLASGNTNTSGYLQVGYTVAEGAGVGVRTIRGEFAGDGGYMASANTGKLTVTAGDLYIWPYVRSGKRGTSHLLKAYVRSLPDYVIQPGKAITFKVNGTEVGTGAVAADGWASSTWSIPADEPTGAHTASAEFAGDAWYKAVTATTSFNVVP